MVTCLFFASIASILAGIFFGKKKKKETGKTGAGRMFIGLLIGLTLLGNCRTVSTHQRYGDAQKAYHMILEDQAGDIFLNGKKINNFSLRFKSVYDYDSVEVVDKNIYFTSKK